MSDKTGLSQHLLENDCGMDSSQIDVLLIGSPPEEGRGIRELLKPSSAQGQVTASFGIVAADHLNGGLEQIKNGNMDIVLLDVSRNPEHLDEGVRAINARVPHLPLIVLSDNENETQAQQALLAGAQDYLVKPEIDHRQLTRSIRYAIKRKQAEHAMRTQREFVTSILESLPHPFYVLDVKDYKIKIANAAAEAVCDGDLSTCYALTHQQDTPCMGAEHACPLEVVLQTRQPHTTRHTHYDQNGQERIIEIHGYPILDKQGEVAEMVEYGLDITERMKIEGQNRFQAQLLSNVRESLIATDLEGKVVYWGRGAESLYGYLAEEVLGNSIQLSVDKDWIAAGAERRAQVLETGHWSGQYWKMRRDGSRFLADTVIFLVRDENGDPSGMIGIDRDSTESVQNQEKARLAAQVFDTTSEAILITDAQAKIISVNKAFSEITGYDAKEALGRNPRFLKSGRHDQAYYQKMWKMLEENGSWRGEIWNRRKDGEIYPEWLTISAVKDENEVVTNYMAIFIDITQRKQNEELLRFLATHDPLTNLPNRELFRNRLRRAISRSQRSGKKVAVLMLDLDGFKAVNDTFGHANGDIVLQTVAERLVGSVRESDTVARLGGDEFIIILEGVASEADATLVVQKILRSTTRPYALNGHRADLTTSIGISLFPDDGGDTDKLMRYADTAMYRAKSEGKDRYIFYRR
jgi:diguanylate cyclase (GGDEF)-like protein/PAS domain S-box-containing protein